MPITYDITEDSFYKEGLEKGLEKGEQRRLKKLIFKGLQMGMDINQIAEMAEVDIDYVLKLKQELGEE